MKNLASEEGAKFDLYAVWEIRKDLTYTVKYLSCDGNQPIREEKVVTNVTFNSVIESTEEIVAIEGYTFHNASVDKLTITTGENVLELYYDANQYTVRFDTKCGWRVRSITVTFDAAYGKLPVLARWNYTFDGWKLGDELVTDQTIVKTAKDHTLVAQWSPRTYQVSFDTAGGEPVDPISVIYNAPYGTLPVPVRPGYTFCGWKLNDRLVTEETIVKLGRNHTLTAEWKANTYRIKLNANGGYLRLKTKTVVFDQPIGCLPTPYRAGFCFQGWMDADGNLVNARTIYKIPENTTLTAKWKSKTSR